MKRLAVLPILVLFALQIGCAGRLPPAVPLESCLRAVLEPAPVWTASAAWNEDESRLLLVDPRTESLLSYGRSGALEEQIDLAPLASFEYSVPIRLNANEDGYVLGDRKAVLTLDRTFRKLELSSPYEGLADVDFGTLNDFVVRGDDIFSYVDYARGETPTRGFARLGLDAPRLDLLYELPFGETDKETNVYYIYERRPYVAGDGENVYAIRYTVPQQIVRMHDDRLEKLAETTVDFLGDEDWSVRSIHAYDGRLWILTRQKTEEAEGKIVAGAAVDESGKPAQMQLNQAVGRLDGTKYRWRLVEIDSRRGDVVARVDLPTSARRLSIVPGRAAWAIVEETALANMGDATTSLLMLPASEFKRSGTHEAVCDAP